MVTYPQLREYMRQRVEEERSIASVQVEGRNIDDALNQASIELGLPVSRLAYEIIRRGSRGLLGMGGKNWMLLAYETKDEESESGLSVGVDDSAVDLGFGDVLVEKNVPGEVFVRLADGDVFLKATKPVGQGARANEQRARETLAQRGISGFDADLVSKVVKNADEEFIRVGSYQYNPANDPIMSVDITEQEMKAFMVVSRPGPGGSDLLFPDMLEFLKSQRVAFGVKEDVLRHFEEHPRYGEAVLVAEGKKAENGNDARIIYNFKTDHSNVKLKERDGKVDFKELNLVENAIAGQLLAKKIPPEEGKAGRTVTGRALPAKTGRDKEIAVGKNVKLSGDDQTAVSEINGQVILIGGKINVEPVYTVQGDVNLHTGNILFLGTVLVKGNVEDGFSVKASGNIEVRGSVGKCELDSEGDIIVHQGILGKNEGNVRSGKSVFAKFIEHARVQAGENVVASDGIIHSHVDANKSVICQGKRAAIVGGRIRAAEEIKTKTLGSVAGSETIVEVGYDPQSKEKQVQLESRKRTMDSELEEIERNIKTLETLEKAQKKLSDDKKNYLTELSERRSELLTTLEAVNKDIGEINAYLSSLKTIGKVRVSGKVHPGVKVLIKNASFVVRSEYKLCTFYLEANEVSITKYDVPREETERRV